MASNASELGLDTARSGVTLSRPRQYTHPSAAGDKSIPDTIGPLVTATGGNKTTLQRMVPPEERCPARSDAHHASAHRGWNIKLLLPVFYLLLVTVTGKEKHWLSSSSNDENVIRIQRGNSVEDSRSPNRLGKGGRQKRSLPVDDGINAIRIQRGNSVEDSRSPNTLGRGGSLRRSPPVDDVIHAYRTQRGNRGIWRSAEEPVEAMRSSKISMSLDAALRRVTGGASIK